MAGAQELLTAFIGLEMSSIASYILASYRRDSPRSNEAAMKYFLLGSFATAFFLYGIALTYGATGTTHLDLMTQTGAQPVGALLKMGMGLILVGLAFKVASAPFHLWAPDVYEGAPAPVTALAIHRPQSCRIRPGHAHPRRCRSRRLSMVLGAMGRRRVQHVRGQPGRNRADQLQAHAGVQLHRSCRIYSGRAGSRSRDRSSGSRNRRRAVLSGELCAW